MSFLSWAFIVLIALAIIAFLAKKILKLDNFLGLFILVKTKKLMSIVEWLSKKKFVEKLATIGVVVGFGAFGIDYLNRNKKTSKLKRFFLFVFNTFVISFVVYFLVGSVFLNNPMISLWGGYLIIFMTGLMGFSGLTIASLIFSGVDIIIKTLAGETAMPGVGLVLPGIRTPKIDFFIPWYGWIILIFSAAIHEFFHGAMLKKFKLKIKSIGVILAGIFPFGAFVEPDQKEMEKTNKHKLVKMYSSGPTSNAVIAVIFFIILFILSIFASPYFSEIESQNRIGIKVTNVSETLSIDGVDVISPAYGVLKEEDLIVSINNEPINNSADIRNATIKDQENKFVLKNLETQEQRTELIKPNEQGTYGFSIDFAENKEFVVPKNYSFLKSLLAIITWIALLNLIISSVNFLPMIPFDGGFMSQVIFSRYLKKGTNKKNMKKVFKFFGILIVLLLLLNVIPYFL